MRKENVACLSLVTSKNVGGFSKTAFSPNFCLYIVSGRKLVYSEGEQVRRDWLGSMEQNKSNIVRVEGNEQFRRGHLFLLESSNP
jgi:hypothetical protein